MSQQDNFSSGFVLGAIVGGVVGGIVGAVVTTQRLTDVEEIAKAEPEKPKRRLRASTEQNMEIARRGLEDKIAQLNDAIDEVRQQLGSVNGRAIERDAWDAKPTREGSIREEP